MDASIFIVKFHVGKIMWKARREKKKKNWERRTCTHSKCQPDEIKMSCATDYRYTAYQDKSEQRFDNKPSGMDFAGTGEQRRHL
ncbi:Hypothetical predicted protein [Podarcis lilfordi]|uniref:Uncharacterized protein n=1 Tax=Podarcis lilfordi TaxID=74358 RepID=A0AA35P8H2_9SAUR|nr:Hypothetical predicted protein [Podarcis lilfordi]